MDNDVVSKEILDAINSKLGSRGLTCPLCEDKRWNPPGLTTLVQFVVAVASPTANLVPTNQCFPLAVLCCGGCGYTILLNLIQLGIWEKMQSQLSIPVGTSLPSSINGAMRLR